MSLSSHAQERDPGSETAFGEASPDDAAGAADCGVHRRVLVVDDDPGVAQSLLRNVRAMGFSASVACADVACALEEVARRPPDLVLMDVSLGGAIDGIEAAALIRQRVDVPVVFISGHADAAMARRAAAVGPYGFLMKPLSPAVLVVNLPLAIARHRADVESRVYEAAVAGASVGIALVTVKDDLRIIERVNDAFCGMTGMPREVIVGNPPCFLASDPSQLAVQRLREALRQLVPAEELVRGGGEGGEFWTQVSLSPVRSGLDRVSHMLVFHKDVTRQRAAEAALAEAQRFETIGQLAAGAAHDFNNVLTSIVASAEFARGVAHDPEQVRDLDDVLDASRRGGLLTRRLLDFARGAPDVQGTVSLADTVADAWHLATRAAGRGVRCSLDVPRQRPGALVDLDATALEQVLLNLVVNARDAMPAGGALRVGVSEVGDNAVLEVRDEGVGMSPEVQRRIFEPLFTTKPRGLGTGIGLSTTRMLVQRAGGHIEVESAPGEGSTFRVILPRSEASPRPSRMVSPQGRRDAEGAACLVAVIDPELRQACVRALRGVGFTVHDAGAAEVALRITAALGTALRFILCEELMHRSSAAAEAPAVPRVVILAEDRAWREPGPMTAFLQKPFEMKTLVGLALSMLS
jgi:two-component system cell cycle sensor histidine kinase/response regulator CckA